MTTKELNIKNLEATTNTKTAREMALTPHRLSGKAACYARCEDGGLWIWSDSRANWTQIDKEKIKK